MKPAKKEWFAAGRWIYLLMFWKSDDHGCLVHRHLQIPTSTSAEQALSHDRDSDDHDRVAAILFQWRWALALFVIGWVLQFVGHAIEGNRPAFFQNPVYFLVGPWWLIRRAAEAIGLLHSSPSK